MPKFIPIMVHSDMMSSHRGAGGISQQMTIDDKGRRGGPSKDDG